MRIVVASIMGLSLFLAPGSVNAADSAAAKAILADAVKAHGGSAALEKLASFTRVSSVQLITAPGKTFTVEQTFVLPTKVRNVVKFEGKQLSMMVLNVDKAWQSSGGPAEGAPEELAKELQEENYVIWLSTLAPFAKESFELDVAPEIKVNGNPAVGVKVARKDRPNVVLYFDKKTNLLVKIERKAREAGLKVRKEYYYSEHKDFDGAKMPTHEIVYIEGSKFTDASGSTFKFLKSVDEELFRRP